MNRCQAVLSPTGCCDALCRAVLVVVVARLQKYLLDMRAHMPPSHRAFLAELEAGPSARSAIHDLTGTLGSSSSSSGSESASTSSSLDMSSGGSGGGLVDAYNEAMYELERFRAQHRGFAQQYIAKFAKKETTGTGGSDFMPALTGYKQTTAASKLRQ